MNYRSIYQNFRQATAYEEQVEHPFFKKASSADMEVLVNLHDMCLSQSAIWRGKDLEELLDLKIPESVIHFYQEMNPSNAPMNDAGISLADLKKIRDEYSKLEPGCYFIRFGLLVIATTIGGNPIIVDLYDENAAVFICEYNLLTYEEENGQPTLYFSFPSQSLQNQYGCENIPVNHQTLLQCMTPIETSFEIFITKLSRNEYDYDLEDLLDADL